MSTKMSCPEAKKKVLLSSISVPIIDEESLNSDWEAAGGVVSVTIACCCVANFHSGLNGIVYCGPGLSVVARFSYHHGGTFIQIGDVELAGCSAFALAVCKSRLFRLALAGLIDRNSQNAFYWIRNNGPVMIHPFLRRRSWGLGLLLIVRHCHIGRDAYAARVHCAAAVLGVSDGGEY